MMYEDRTMIATLMTKYKYCSLVLPEKVMGQYFFDIENDRGQILRAATIEGIADRWFLKSFGEIMIITS